MAITDPIGDLLTRIRNGQLRGMAKIKSPNSRQRVRVLDVLQAEGFIRGSVTDLKPHRNGLGLSIVSTPQGVMTDSHARDKNVGGEVLCHVF
jgi:small subunit ribosomal protein S8